MMTCLYMNVCSSLVLSVCVAFFFSRALLPFWWRTWIFTCSTPAVIRSGESLWSVWALRDVKRREWEWDLFLCDDCEDLSPLLLLCKDQCSHLCCTWCQWSITLNVSREAIITHSTILVAHVLNILQICSLGFQYVFFGYQRTKKQNRSWVFFPLVFVFFGWDFNFGVQSPALHNKVDKSAKAAQIPLQNDFQKLFKCGKNKKQQLRKQNTGAF